MSAAALFATWNYPTTVWVGPGRIGELPQACQALGMARPLLVTDRGLAGSAILRSALDAATAGGLSPDVFGEVKSNPTGGNVEAGLGIYRAGGHDGVIAFGGGSAIDAAKAIALMSGQERPLWDFEDLGDNWMRADTAGMAPVVAIPTTAGTGSEVGRAAVILDEAVWQKKIIFHPRMMPRLVIADPLLTVDLPPAITAATGMDALAHCFEAYCAPGFHPMADGIALEGMSLIERHLLHAYRDGHDLEARAGMLAAAAMGATAFQKGLGAVHALAHPIGALYDTHHGLTNAVLLPYVMLHNRPVIAERMAHLARVLALPAAHFEAVLDWMLWLRVELGIPHTLAQIGVPADRVRDIARMAQADPSAPGNPVPVDAAALERMFLSAVEGRLG